MNPIVQLGPLSEIKLREIEVFYLTAKTRSVRETARRLESTPGQISKIVKNIERKLQAPLFRRSQSGMLVSEAGAELLLYAERILDSAYEMVSNRRSGAHKSVAIAATPFLLQHLVAFAASAALNKGDSLSLRLMDVTPDQIVPLGLRGAFDAAFHFDELEWPQTWHQEKIGTLGWVLCARAGHPLKKNTSQAEVVKYPFICPTYWTSNGLMRANDFYGIPMAKRLQGFETSTADAVVPLLLQTDQLSCLPELIVRPHLKSGALKTITAAGVKSTKRDLFLSAKADSVSHLLYERMKEKAAGILASGPSN